MAVNLELYARELENILGFESHRLIVTGLKEPVEGRSGILQIDASPPLNPEEEAALTAAFKTVDPNRCGIVPRERIVPPSV